MTGEYLGHLLLKLVRDAALCEVASDAALEFRMIVISSS
jgi:hypothetical protein